VGEKTVLTAPLVPPHSARPRLRLCHGTHQPVKPIKDRRKKSHCFLSWRVALSQFLIGMLQDLL